MLGSYTDMELGTGRSSHLISIRLKSGKAIGVPVQRCGSFAMRQRNSGHAKKALSIPKKKKIKIRTTKGLLLEMTRITYSSSISQTSKCDDSGNAMESSQSAGPTCIHLQASFFDEEAATGILGVVVCGMSACGSKSVVFRLRERKERGGVEPGFRYKYGFTVVMCLFKRLSFPLFKFFAFLTPIFSMMTPECLLKGKGISFSKRASSS